MEIEVKGHSGCRVDVVAEGRELYVCKSTADPRYLERLAKQAEKQREAGRMELQHIRVPQIYGIERTERSTVVKMQYVYSKNFIEFFEQAGFEQVGYLIGALEYFIDYEVGACSLRPVDAELFRTKFAGIRSAVACNPEVRDDGQVARILDEAREVFDGLRTLLLPVGVCHGDLTFSNILFNGNNYYLIDFLDSFVETPLQDIAKIRQDTAFRWSQLMYTKRYDAVRLGIVCEKIDAEIDSYFSARYRWYADHYRTLQLMNLLRILPYAREARVVAHLKNMLNEILHEM